MQNEDPRQAPPEPHEMKRLELGVIVAIASSVLVWAFSAGVLWNDVQDQDRRLLVVEAKSTDTTERLARIESNLDFLVDQYKSDMDTARDARNAHKR